MHHGTVAHAVLYGIPFRCPCVHPASSMLTGLVAECDVKIDLVTFHTTGDHLVNLSRYGRQHTGGNTGPVCIIRQHAIVTMMVGSMFQHSWMHCITSVCNGGLLTCVPSRAATHRWTRNGQCRIVSYILCNAYTEYYTIYLIWCVAAPLRHLT